ncbi:hypothetical protein KM043_001830 [Ampulex compressa]|nr:hypothetical protein KM043_001830 [Ampulex compressa]
MITSRAVLESEVWSTVCRAAFLPSAGCSRGDLGARKGRGTLVHRAISVTADSPPLTSAGPGSKKEVHEDAHIHRHTRLGVNCGPALLTRQPSVSNLPSSKG